MGTMARQFANIHDDRGLEVAVVVETGTADPKTAFEDIYGARLRNSDVWLQFYTVGGDGERFSGSVDATAGTYRRLGTLWSGLPDDVVVVRGAHDLEAVRQRKKRGIVLTIEGAAPIAYDLSTLENFYRLGLRSVCLTWFRGNQVGDGVGEQRNAGLTNFGRQALAKMEDLKLLIDISQCSQRTLADVLECTSRPLIASHSNAAGRYQHVRNLSDEVLKEIGSRGGVVGLTTYPAHVGSGHVTLGDFAEHVAYVCQVAGDHVPALGLNIMAGSDAVERRFLGGADIEMTSLHLPGIDDISSLGNVVDALRSRGLSEGSIDAVCWGNAVRVVSGLW